MFCLLGNFIMDESAKLDIGGNGIVMNNNAGSCIFCHPTQCSCPRTSYSNDNIPEYGDTTNSLNFKISGAVSLSNHQQTFVQQSVANKCDESVKKAVFMNCRICGAKCVRITSYENHWKRVHHDLDPIHMFENAVPCDECNRYFPSYTSYRQHYSCAHSRFASSVNRNKRMDHNNSIATVTSKNVKQKPNDCQQPSDVKRYCPLCGFIVDSYAELVQHLDVVHDGLQVHSNNFARLSEQSAPIHRQVPFCLTCARCGFICHDEIKFHIHMKICMEKDKSKMLLVQNPYLKSLSPIEKTMNPIAFNDNKITSSQNGNSAMSNVQPYQMYPLVLLGECGEMASCAPMDISTNHNPGVSVVDLTLDNLDVEQCGNNIFNNLQNGSWLDKSR